jgi:hypothetical protein
MVTFLFFIYIMLFCSYVSIAFLFCFILFIDSFTFPYSPPPSLYCSLILSLLPSYSSFFPRSPCPFIPPSSLILLLLPFSLPLILTSSGYSHPLTLSSPTPSHLIALFSLSLPHCIPPTPLILFHSLLSLSPTHTHTPTSFFFSFLLHCPNSLPSLL